jgi:hypothetical protein
VADACASHPVRGRFRAGALPTRENTVAGVNFA